MKGISKNHIKRTNNDWHWAYNVMLIGIFVGIFAIMIASQKTFITKMEISRMFTFFSFIWFIIPLRLYKRWLGLNKLAIVLLGVFGIGPLILSITLWLNILLIDSHETISYKVEEVIPESYHITNQGLTSVLLVLENNSMSQYPEFRRVEYLGDRNILRVDSVRFRLGKGFFGYDVIKERSLIYP